MNKIMVVESAAKGLWTVALRNNGMATIGVPYTYSGDATGYTTDRGEAVAWARALANVLGEPWSVQE